MAVNLGSAYAEIELDTSGLSRDVANAERAFGRLDGSLSTMDTASAKAGRSLDGLGAALGGPVVLGAAAAGAALIGVGVAMADIQASAAEVERAMGDLDDATLQAVTADAEYLARTFGVDITESARTADRIIDEFGVNAENAFRLLEQGQQRGLDRFGDLNDTLNEYANDFARLGMTGPETLARIEAGLEAGFRNTDNIGDAFNEFNIRLQETARIEPLQGIDEDTAAVVAAFQSGAITSEQAFAQIGDAVRAIEDPIRQNAALVELFGTKAEDAGPEAALALLAPAESMADVTNAIAEGERQYATFGALWADVSSQLQASLLPIAGALLELASAVMPLVTQAIANMQPFIEQVVSGITMLTTTITAFATGGSEQITTLSAFWAEHGAQIMQVLSQMGMRVQDIAALIGEVLAMLAVFWQQHGDQVMLIVSTSMESIMLIIDTILLMIRTAIEVTLGLIQGDYMRVWNAMRAFTDGVLQNIWGIISNAFENMLTTITIMAEQWGLPVREAFASMEQAWQTFNASFVQPLLQGFAAIQDRVNQAMSVFQNFANQVRNFEMPEFNLPEFDNPFDGFARGGMPPLNTPVMVGEEGPELVSFSRPATITPANETQQMLNRAAQSASGGVSISIGSISIPGASPDMDMNDLAYRVAQEIQQRANI